MEIIIFNGYGFIILLIVKKKYVIEMNEVFYFIRYNYIRILCMKVFLFINLLICIYISVL